MKHPNKCLRVRQTEYIKNGGRGDEHLHQTQHSQGQRTSHVQERGWLSIINLPKDVNAKTALKKITFRSRFLCFCAFSHLTLEVVLPLIIFISLISCQLFSRLTVEHIKCLKLITYLLIIFLIGNILSGTHKY